MTITSISSILDQQRNQLLDHWMAAQLSASTYRPDLIQDDELRAQSAQFLDALGQAIAHADVGNIDAPAWDDLREQLSDLSESRLLMGFSPTETATFVFSLKEPLFEALKRAHGQDGAGLLEDNWKVTTLLDRLGLYSVEAFTRGREQLIRRQQQEMLELSTPVVRLWEGILALPLIGTLDSERTQIVMENLLGEIDRTGSTIAVIDITGVPMVDTLVAQHLLKAAAAARLMGAQVIISGIRPQIAQTIVQIGVEMPDIVTRASLADAFSMALDQTGWTISRDSR